MLSMASGNQRKTKEGNLQLHILSLGEKRMLLVMKQMEIPLFQFGLCAKHKEKLLANPNLKGKAKSDALNYTEKVTFVKKGNVERPKPERLGWKKNWYLSVSFVVVCIPVYFCAALQDCNEFGGTDADSLKLAIDTAFDKDNGSIKISEDAFHKRMVSSTADGASVNFGRYNGVLTQQKETRPWLITIHCVAHRAELALKDSLLSFKEFKMIDDLMTSVFYLHRRSGKLKRMFRNSANALNIDGYVFPKVTGTRFVTHRLKGTKSFYTIGLHLRILSVLQFLTERHNPWFNRKFKAYSRS